VLGLVTTPGKAHTTEVAELAEPRPGPGELLLRTLAVGVCGTDREIS
jgi:glucose 1-dehydrogenase